ncbi:hypothetical protein [Streptomyces sp. NBC_00443]|uniref:hypothetical protein n=1 Tax=Streptomyces sp. NBC_00443 TaxID=2975743 RepID=UPI002E206360
MPLQAGQLLRLGDGDGQVVSTPGHTPGHPALWQENLHLALMADAARQLDRKHEDFAA